ncbi:MAG: sugar ABC transporter permease, partial [Clostridia bacterium]|nr:sugar ABC transporter permease [Clostridia bacterium]
LPVIIASSVVVRLLGVSSLDVAVFDLSTEGTGILNYESFFENLNLPSSITDVLVFFLSNAVSLTWNGGVQTILFLAGLQNIPASLYEVSKIEGANKWEEFWLITIPMLRHILSLVMIYTMIALFTSANNSVMTSSIALMQARDYGVASAMLWFYFVIIIAVMGLFLFLYNRFCVKKWD